MTLPHLLLGIDNDCKYNCCCCFFNTNAIISSNTRIVLTASSDILSAVAHAELMLDVSSRNKSISRAKFSLIAPGSFLILIIRNIMIIVVIIFIIRNIMIIMVIIFI